ncbi:uncharacterized protein LOC131675544 [Phymastichus coffea]|uniref:uncharacterized protein LOC131675544 n=1 Tax=Phymastichus coffea TaxID=108790 RepID=UPI00273A84E0|nr:uncharacterized protein LOC131675544 [Phymastichus coffea]
MIKSQTQGSQYEQQENNENSSNSVNILSSERATIKVLILHDFEANLKYEVTVSPKMYEKAMTDDNFAMQIFERIKKDRVLKTNLLLEQQKSASTSPDVINSKSIDKKIDPSESSNVDNENEFIEFSIQDSKQNIKHTVCGLPENNMLLLSKILPIQLIY